VSDLDDYEDSNRDYSRDASLPSPTKGDGTGDLLLKMIDDLVEYGAFQAVFYGCLEQLPESSDALKQLPFWEQQQLLWWYQRVLAQELPELDDSSYGVNEMIGQARCLLLEHRLSVSHRLNIGILGPKLSGKSTFLRVLYNELLLELIATETWKKTFVLVLDFASVAAFVANFVECYRTIVSATFRELRWQRPQLAPHLPIIQAYFESIPLQEYVPPIEKLLRRDELKKPLAADLQGFANELFKVWHQPDALLSWLGNVFLFPRHIAEILGFTKVIVVIDHFDAADVTLIPESTPFPDSPTSISLYDVLKVLLSSVNYIVAAQNESDFCGLLPSGTPELNIDLGGTISLCSTVGLIAPCPDESEQFILTFADDPAPFTLTAAMCGGAPGYLRLWNEFAELASEVESDEDELILLASAQELLGLLFRSGDLTLRSLEVTACKLAQPNATA
jgi:hypothetical protein